MYICMHAHAYTLAQLQTHRLEEGRPSPCLCSAWLTCRALCGPQVDKHIAEMTVRETMAFSAKLMGQGSGIDGACGWARGQGWMVRVGGPGVRDGRCVWVGQGSGMDGTCGWARGQGWMVCVGGPGVRDGWYVWVGQGSGMDGTCGYGKGRQSGWVLLGMTVVMNVHVAERLICKLTKGTLHMLLCSHLHCPRPIVCPCPRPMVCPCPKPIVCPCPRPMVCPCPRPMVCPCPRPIVCPCPRPIVCPCPRPMVCPCPTRLLGCKPAPLTSFIIPLGHCIPCLHDQ